MTNFTVFRHLMHAFLTSPAALLCGADVGDDGDDCPYEGRRSRVSSGRALHGRRRLDFGLLEVQSMRTY